MNLKAITIVALSLLMGTAHAQEMFKGVAESLGPEINTEYGETDARISPDGSTLYFVRWFSPANIGGMFDGGDIWYSEKDKNGNFTEAKNMGSTINDDQPNFLIGIRPDGNAMILKGAYDDTLNTNLYISYKKNDKWQSPKPMSFEGVEAEFNYIGYTVSSDFKHLVIAKNEFSDADLYVCNLTNNGNWGEAKPLTNINTNDNEAWPLLASDDQTLYFTSDGYECIGSSDIFMAKRTGDDWTQWSEPINLGAKVNTEMFDADFIADTQGKYAYFSSNKNSDGFDIYKITLGEAAKPEPVVLVSGHVYNEKNKDRLETEVKYYELETGKEIGSLSASINSGYKIVLPYGKKYGFRASAEGFASVSDNIDLTKNNPELSENTEYQEITRDLYLVPLETGSLVRINNLFFPTGSAEIETSSLSDLNNIVEMMNENPDMSILLKGHTDNVGSSESNQTLSTARAKAVFDFLIRKEISATRLKYKGYGENKPVSDNNSDKGRRLNRRVEFEIIKN